MPIQPIETSSDLGTLDLVTHSPDGESRGMFERVGDVFPLSPFRHILTSIADAPTPVRPWGLRFAEIPRPSAGKHEGSSKATSGHTDGTSGGEETSDD
ncbi:hypothetical protein GCM10010329_17530 [Streptomyces spiroverticillatus]|uniref:Uncharacterized protein n=1 Tax=Streptomyces finlayi TaxID=67296 RepID=A0A918WTR5_9ACTN|nr:hypothetical protein [Streptomyces finlayi]GGZ96790.1 hypothetical protein GCM10010329_17530 [Streptomyces spiroverticillatus]GHC82076.1 hypothetical protein GCM10010334_10010 [Streptomyces finlayi]